MPPTARQSTALRLAGLFLASVAFVWVISYVTLVLLSAAVRPPKEIELVIPRGTAERIAAGEPSPSIPPNISFVMGDVLVLRNEDVVDHQIGPFWVPPERSTSISFDEPRSLSYACSIHPSGAIGLEVQPRDDVRLTVLPTLILGVPLGLVAGLLYLILSRLRAE